MEIFTSISEATGSTGPAATRGHHRRPTTGTEAAPPRNALSSHARARPLFSSHPRLCCDLGWTWAPRTPASVCKGHSGVRPGRRVQMEGPRPQASELLRPLPGRSGSAREAALTGRGPERRPGRRASHPDSSPGSLGRASPLSVCPEVPLRWTPWEGDLTQSGGAGTSLEGLFPHRAGPTGGRSLYAPVTTPACPHRCRDLSSPWTKAPGRSQRPTGPGMSDTKHQSRTPGGVSVRPDGWPRLEAGLLEGSRDPGGVEGLGEPWGPRCDGSTQS